VSYTFRLRGLLKMFERERDHRQDEVQLTENILQLAEAEIRLTWEGMERSQVYFEELSQATPCLQGMGHSLQHFQSQRDALNNILRVRIQLEEQLARQQADLLVAKRNVRRLEMLRDRQLDQHKIEMLLKQQTALDEFSTQQFARRKIPSASPTASSL